MLTTIAIVYAVSLLWLSWEVLNVRETNHEKLPLMLEVKDFERAFMDYVPARQAYPNALEVGIEADIFISTQNPIIVETLDISADDLAVYFFENAHKYGIEV